MSNKLQKTDDLGIYELYLLWLISLKLHKLNHFVQLPTIPPYPFGPFGTSKKSLRSKTYLFTDGARTSIDSAAMADYRRVLLVCLKNNWHDLSRKLGTFFFWFFFKGKRKHSYWLKIFFGTIGFFFYFPTQETTTRKWWVFVTNHITYFCDSLTELALQTVRYPAQLPK